MIQNRYRLVEWLGRGNMGVVYRAQDEVLGREVAIKFLLPDKIVGEIKTRFIREGRTLARLSHPNIMAIYDVGQDETEDIPWHYLILEYVSGKNLHQQIQAREGKLSVADALHVISSVLKALVYAHAQGMIHRDIKPENILLTPGRQVKVSDFGLALHGADVRLTREGEMVGTPLYMAPELLLGEEADHRADLFAVGAIFYEALTGYPPFRGDNFVTIISQILHTPVPPLRASNQNVPEELEKIIVRLLAKTPDARYSSAEEVLVALENISEKPIERREDLQHGSTLPHGGTLPQLEETTVNQAVLSYAATEEAAEAVEAERRRLAGLLQKSVVEPLNLLLSQAGIYEQTLSSNPTARMAVSVLTTLARQVLQQTRDLESNLHPVVLDTLGLEPALEMLANQATRNYGLQIRLELERMRERIPASLELILFRAAQDLLERVTRRARATLVTIQLARRGDTLTFEWWENTSREEAEERAQAIYRRIEQLGGQVQIESVREGFKVIIRFKLTPPIELTEREKDVIMRLVEGYSNKDIARSLVISPRTVNFHLDNIYNKLGIRSRTEAAIYALRQGWARRKL